MYREEQTLNNRTDQRVIEHGLRRKSTQRSQSTQPGNPPSSAVSEVPPKERKRMRGPPKKDEKNDTAYR